MCVHYQFVEKRKESSEPGMQVQKWQNKERHFQREAYT